MLIYIIRNYCNDRVYIGQTSCSLKERIRGYKNDVKFANRSRPIINAMRKYGFEAFYFEILKDNIETKKELDRWERFYIKKYNSLCSQNGYNVELGGNGKGKHSKETKQKISKAQTGVKNHMYGKTGSMNKTSKKVIELTTGKYYDSASLAACELSLGFSHVCAVCRGDRASTGGYVFRYVDENNNIIPTQNHATIKAKSTEHNVLPKFQKYI